MNQKKHISGLLGALPALLLSVWYLFAVSGIDIHRDAEHGHVFVVPGFVGSDCDLIHPGEHCLDSAMETEAECLDGEDCCSDDFTAILAQVEAPDTGASILPPPASIPVAGLHAHPALAETTASVSGGRGNAPPPPGLSAPFSKLSVLRI